MITINQSDGRGLTNIHGTEATNALSIPITFPRLMHPQVVMTNLRDNLRCEIDRIPGFTKPNQSDGYDLTISSGYSKGAPCVSHFHPSIS